MPGRGRDRSAGGAHTCSLWLARPRPRAEGKVTTRALHDRHKDSAGKVTSAWARGLVGTPKHARSSGQVQGQGSAEVPKKRKKRRKKGRQSPRRRKRPQSICKQISQATWPRTLKGRRENFFFNKNWRGKLCEKSDRH